jgi:hypothetical protein
MPSTRTTTTTTTQQPILRLRLDGSDGSFGDWQDDLIKNGYAVIKGAIPKERAAKYVDEMHEWLESL